VSYLVPMGQFNLLNMKPSNLSSMLLILQLKKKKKKDIMIVYFITLKVPRLLRFGCDQMQALDF